MAVKIWETKEVDDEFETLLTVLATFVTKIIYLSTYLWGTNIQKSYQFAVNNIKVTPTSILPAESTPCLN